MEMAAQELMTMGKEPSQTWSACVGMDLAGESKAEHMLRPYAHSGTLDWEAVRAACRASPLTVIMGTSMSRGVEVKAER